MLPPRVRSAELRTRTVSQRDCSAKKALAQPTQDTARECLFNSTAKVVAEQLAGTATHTAESHGEHGKAPACTTPRDNSTPTGTRRLNDYKLCLPSPCCFTIPRLTTKQKKTCSPNSALLCGSDEGERCLCSIAAAKPPVCISDKAASEQTFTEFSERSISQKNKNKNKTKKPLK